MGVECSNTVLGLAIAASAILWVVPFLPWLQSGNSSVRALAMTRTGLIPDFIVCSSSALVSEIDVFGHTRSIVTSRSCATSKLAEHHYE